MSRLRPSGSRAAAEQLIVKGKEQGFSAPDDVLTSFPDIEAEPDQLERIFAAFSDMGIAGQRR